MIIYIRNYRWEELIRLPVEVHTIAELLKMQSRNEFLTPQDKARIRQYESDQRKKKRK